MYEHLSPSLRTTLDGLPACPGVYVFRDQAGATLYVGKAKSLRARVRSYFQAGSSDQRQMLPALLGTVEQLETIVTDSEKEATILENNLIKEWQPRFNAKLRDDKEYLTLRLDESVEWARLELVRRPKSDGARYFGPFHSASAARRSLHLVEKHFQLRTCSDREMASRARPCLQYQIRRCPAPCLQLADASEYRRQVEAVECFLEGRHSELVRTLKERMKGASEQLHYELAATYRDQLRALEVLRDGQRVVSVSDANQEVLGLYREGDLVELSLLSIREGRLVDAAAYSHTRVDLPDDEVVATFLREQYGAPGAGASIPDEVLLPVLPEGAEGIMDWLAERRAEPGVRRRKRPVLLAPCRGQKRHLVQLASDNARHAFAEKRRASEGMESRLAKIQQRLRLPTLPRRMECTDISHLGGEDTVGSVVAFKDGQPDKKRYRTYKVKAATHGDDYAAMYEVLHRRFVRGRDDGADWELPDLFLVDGGRGQLAVAVAAATELGLFKLPLAGLAKERDTASGQSLTDRVYRPGQKNPIALHPNTPELFVLAHMRDEAHRFANRGRKKLGKSRRIASELERIPGIGPKTRAALLRHFGTIAALKTATDTEIRAVPGLHRGHLQQLRAFWPKDE